MTPLTRIRNRLSAQWRKSGRLGKVTLLLVPLLFGCCFFSLVLSNFVADPTPEPTAELADRAAATADLTEPTDEPPTTEPTDEPTATPRPPTATPVPPTATPRPPTATPPPPTATPIPQPTAPLLAANLEIVAVNKRAEYVDIRNNTGADVMMTGWILRSEKGSHDCPLDGVGLFPTGDTLRVWAMTHAPAQGEFSCNFDNEIWNNSESDPAVLINPSGQEVARR